MGETIHETLLILLAKERGREERGRKRKGKEWGGGPYDSTHVNAERLSKEREKKKKRQNRKRRWEVTEEAKRKGKRREREEKGEYDFHVFHGALVLTCPSFATGTFFVRAHAVSKRETVK